MSKFNLKRSLPLFITSAALLVSLSGCGGDSQEICELRNQIEILQEEVEKKEELLDAYESEINDKENEIKSLEATNEQLISQLEDINELQEKNEETQNKGDSVSEDNGKPTENEPISESSELIDYSEQQIIDKLFEVPGIGKIDRKTAESLFYKDGQLVVNMGNAYYMKYYNSYHGGPDSRGYVKEIVKDEIKYLVDADDICNVLLCDYESISAPFYLKYYNSYHGGLDTGVGQGYVVEIVKHGVKYLVDANNFSQVLLCDYESISAPFYLKYYNSYHGGQDTGEGQGYVVEIVKHGVKYLADANDFSQVLLYNYEDVYCTENPGEIVVTYPDGMINTFYNDKNFKPHTDYVLSRSLKKR